MPLPVWGWKGELSHLGRAVAIADEKGRVMAAQFGAPSREDADADKKTPVSELLPLPGHHLVEMEVPDELEQLSGEEMARFLLPRQDLLARGREGAEGRRG